MPSHSQDQPRLDKFSSAAEIEKVLAKNRQKMAALSEAFRQLGRSTGSTHLARRPVEERRRDQEVLGKLMEGLPEQERLPPEQHSVASKIVEQELPPKLPKTSQPSTHVESDEKDLQRAVDIGLLERALNEFDVPGIGFKQWLNELLPNNGHSKERLEVSGDEFLESISSIFRRASLKRPDWQDLAWLQSQFPHFSLSANVSLSAREVVAIGKLCFESALAKLLEEVGQDCFPPPVRYPITTKTTVSPRTTETGIPSGSGVASARSTPRREQMVSPSPVSSTGSLSGSASYGFAYIGSSSRPGLGPTRMRVPPQRQNSLPNPTTVPPVRMNQQQLKHQSTVDGAVFSARTSARPSPQPQQQHQQQSARGHKQPIQISQSPVSSGRTPLNSARQSQPQQQQQLSARQSGQPPPPTSSAPQQPLLSPRVSLMHKEASSSKPPSLMNPVLQSTARFQAPPRSARSGATLEQL